MKLEFELEIVAAETAFTAENKKLNDETGQLEVERGDELVAVHFKPVLLRKAEFVNLVSGSANWTVSVERK